MRLICTGILAGVVLVGLAGCSDDEGPPRTTTQISFDAWPSGERVFEAYRQRGFTTKKVLFPKGSREVAVTMDCAGSDGRLKVDFSETGGAGVACAPQSINDPAFVVLSGDGSLLKRSQTVTITGPNDQQWSVAIDAGSKLTTN